MSEFTYCKENLMGLQNSLNFVAGKANKEDVKLLLSHSVVIKKKTQMGLW